MIKVMQHMGGELMPQTIKYLKMLKIQNYQLWVQILIKMQLENTFVISFI